MDLNIFEELENLRINDLGIKKTVPFFLEPTLIDNIGDYRIHSPLVSLQHHHTDVSSQAKPFPPIYIRDQSCFIGNNDISSINELTETKYKFHISWCQKLEELFQKGTFDKYVTQTRSDGKFTVYIIANDNSPRRMDVKLSVCRYCLATLNYKDYATLPKNGRDYIFNNFSLDEFFKEYKINFPINTKYTDDNAPINCYSDNWSKISATLRKRFNNTCQRCGKIGLTHVHHRDGNKNNNSPSNLDVICFDCHAAIHPHLKNTKGSD